MIPSSRKQVNAFPYLKTRHLCVLLHYLKLSLVNSTVKINCLISNYDITIKSGG